MAYVYYSFYMLPLVLLSIFLRRDRLFLLYCFTVFLSVFIFGLSYKVGSDWVNYHAYYEDGCTGFPFDIGFEYLCLGFNSLSINFWIFSFFIKAFYITILARFLWGLGFSPLIAFFSCILVSFVFLDNMLRQQVAFALLLISVGCMRNSLPLSMLSCVLASLFHFSAIFFIPFYFLFLSINLRATFVLISAIAFLLGIAGVWGSAFLKVLSVFEGGYFSRALIYLEFDGYPVTPGHYFRFLILLSFLAFDLILKRRTLDTAERYAWNLISSGVILMLFYEMVFYEFSVFWMRIREYFLVFFMVSPLFLIRTFIGRGAGGASGLYIAYPLIVFGGIVNNLPVYDELYKDYKNYISYLVFGDDEFDAARDSAVQDYWERWRRGELR